ncbi:PAS domain-containing protein [Clostridiaceae bacterium UIB06]|uniref:histidine kinase n=1 Tax=Clostridium thailandense TaxID=2794346 RepID=A0A949TVM9_9CLOT|nr:ATP-binding protein [Clostridium thailandense]MBV7271813.1 PAS domain-containing protein [Clostridium thailandense]MCH5135609.1 PAS domain-containing protein [Clostridiaceae bacterium UIB06]
MENFINGIFKTNNFTENIIEALPNRIYITDSKGDIIYVNKKGKDELMKLGFGDLKNAYELFYDYDVFLENKNSMSLNDFPVYRTLKNKEKIRNVKLEYKLEEKNLYVSISSFPVIEENKIIGSIMDLEDITENYLKELKIKNEREKFLELSTELKTKCDIIEILRNREKEHLMHLKDVINNISEGIMVLDSNEKLSLCNKAVFNILSLNAIELVNPKKFLERYETTILEDETQDIASMYYIYVKSKKPAKNLIVKLREKNTSQIKYLELNTAPIINKNEELVYTILTIKDVTETKLHQINAEEQAEFIKDVVNTIEVPIAVVDYPGITYRLNNKKYDEIIRYGDVELIKDSKDKNLIKYINHDLYKILVNVGEKFKAYTISPYRVKSPTGEDRFYKIKFIPCRNKDNVTRIHIHGSDITEEVNRNIELEKLTKLKDETFTIISHELRTPLTIMYSSLQLAYDVYSKEITPNIGKTLGRIDQNCSRLLKLINNVLDISKAEAGFLTLNNTGFDIVYISETIVNSANSYAISKGIELIFDTDEEEYNVRLDKDKYEKILLNLLSNAVKFTPEGKQIIVSLKMEKDNFYLSVKDFGVGIPEDKIDLIFDRFAQVNSSLSRRAEGTGIGLALVKKFVELMGAEIKVTSEVGKGTEFIVKFKKISAETNVLNNYAILTANLDDKINIEFSDIN